MGAFHYRPKRNGTTAPRWNLLHACTYRYLGGPEPTFEGICIYVHPSTHTHIHSIGQLIPPCTQTQLATSTNSSVLHVLIADRLVDALINQTKMVTQYVKDLDTNKDPELKEIELEMFSAIVNDAGLHIENVDAVIENFELEEIQERIDKMFDSVTTGIYGLVIALFAF